MQVKGLGSNGAINGVVRVAQLEQCYGQLPISLAVNLANGFILVAVLWAYVDQRLMVFWILLLVAVTGGRYLALHAFRTAPMEARSDYHRWSRYFVRGACAAGVVWGAAGALLFHPYAFPYQVLLAFVLGGMVAGAIPLLSSVDHAYRCFAIPVIVPIAANMLWVGDGIHLIMGLTIVIFGVAMLASSTQVQRLFRDGERLRQELLASIETGQALQELIRVDALAGLKSQVQHKFGICGFLRPEPLPGCASPRFVVADR